MVVASSAIFAEAKADTALYQKNKLYDRYIELFKLNRIKQANVVMLGNSITHGGNWNELLGRQDVVEQGIPSDIVEGFLNRIDYVTKLKPEVCFIMGGINDIYSWVPLPKIMRDYRKIIKELKKHNITPVIQSTLYAGKKWNNSSERNKEVIKFNKMLKSYAEKNDIIYMDLIPYFSEGMFLKEKYTHDNLHLNAAGYKVWVKEIDKVLLKLGL